MAFSTYLTREINSLLKTDHFGSALRGYDSIDSTNLAALQWAAEGAPEGSVVIADHQTRGRGRRGRRWSDFSGRNLLFSVVLRPSFRLEERGLLSLAAAVAVAEAIDVFASPHHTMLKWPNDLLLNQRKTGGILLESSLNGKTQSPDSAIVLGIGINVNQTDFAHDLAERATSLILEVGRPFSRAALLAHILERLEAHYDALLTGARQPLLDRYTERFAGRGTTITLYRHQNVAPVRGTILGITDEGALRLRLADGEHTFHAGDVTTHPPK